MVSHDRAWNDPNNPEKSEELAFEIEGAVIEQTFQAPDNGDRESDWQYTVSIAPPEGVPAESEGDYWTVDGPRSASVQVRAVGWEVKPYVHIGTVQSRAVEGSTVVFTLTRSGANLDSPLTVTAQHHQNQKRHGENTGARVGITFPAGVSEVAYPVEILADRADPRWPGMGQILLIRRRQRPL